MTQTIASVTAPHIEHGILIEMRIPNSVTGVPEYHRVSNCYVDVFDGTNTYQALGGFLDITDIQGDLQSTNNEISLSLSGIPSEFIDSVVKQAIKGSTIKIYRAFFDTATQNLKVVATVKQIFLRFNGVINNYSISEEINSGDNNPSVTHTITITASSILGILEHRRAGRRTNKKAYQVNYGERLITSNITSDPSLSRVEALKNASFDFGKKV